MAEHPPEQWGEDNPHPLSQIAGELIWEGKYDVHGKRRVVDVDALIRPLITTERFPGEGEPNWLLHGDNLEVMASLLPTHEGKIDLITIDPPFDAGSNFTLDVEVGGADPKRVETLAYRDIWGRGEGSYAAMMADRLALMHRLLSPKGSIYVHVDERVAPLLRAIMDEIFGAENFLREIIWRIGWVSGFKSAAKNWIRNHDVILYYRKGKEFTFNKEHIPYPEGYVRRDGKPPKGKGYPLEDTWNCSDLDTLDSIQIKSFSREKTGYVTQKNEALLERIIRASSHPGDLVADFFCGSGTVGAVAGRLGRRWIMSDIGQPSITTCRKRLAAIEEVPFVIQRTGETGWLEQEGNLKIEVQPTDSGSVEISLRGFLPDLSRVPVEQREHLLATGDGLDLVDFWSVGTLDKDEGAFCHRAYFFRTRYEREISLSVELSWQDLEPSPVVMVIDAFGNQWIQEIVIPAEGDRETQLAGEQAKD